MRRICMAIGFVLMLTLVVGCGGEQPTSTTESTVAAEPTSPPTSTEPAAEPTAVPTEPEATTAPAEPTSMPTYEPIPLPTDRGDYFAGAGACTSCHNNLVDSTGVDVSIGDYWRSTMMANAARDPYWEATVRGEVLTNPDLRPVIEDKCAQCHTPMARFTAATAGGEGSLLDDGFLSSDNALHTLALDGVSCTLCHQVQPDNFGAEESFSGGYAIDAETPAGDRELFGPYDSPAELVSLMQVASGYVAARGEHMAEAELCATCHTRYTPYVDSEGEIAGEFPEQMPYFEWLNSDHSAEQPCQGCHMPVAEGTAQLSNTGGPQRSPFSKHVFIGGNVYVLQILRAFGEEREVAASSDHFEATIERGLDQLENRTATLALEDVALADGVLTADVAITNLAGHKFPSGFPSRRAWLYVAVTDGAGELIFESGAVDATGAIIGNDNDEDPATFEPHYDEIVASDQVQVYEAIMGDTEGAVTTTLLRGAGYLKDNRLLPRGFDKAGAIPDIAVYGQAAGDDDFVGGGDRVRYAVDVGDAAGPFAVTVELRYQSIGYRWAQNVGAYDTDESADFMRYYDNVPNLPLVIATATAEAGE